MMVEVSDPGMEAQEGLGAFPSSEPLLTALLSSCGSMFLLNNVIAARRGDHLLVVNVSQARDLSDGCSVAPELVGMNDLWDSVFSQQPGQKGVRRLGIPMPLKENVEHEPVPVYGPPSPISNAIDARPHLILSANSASLAF